MVRNEDMGSVPLRNSLWAAQTRRHQRRLEHGQRRHSLVGVGNTGVALRHRAKMPPSTQRNGLPGVVIATPHPAPTHKCTFLASRHITHTSDYQSMACWYVAKAALGCTRDIP